MCRRHLKVSLALSLCALVLDSLAFADQEMDGEAIVAALATCSGPDCLKDVIPKLGSRLKVYNALKVVISDCYKLKVCSYVALCALYMLYIKLGGLYT